MLIILQDTDQGCEYAVDAVDTVDALDACYTSMSSTFELLLNLPSESIHSSESQISDGLDFVLELGIYFITCGSTIVD